MVKKIVRKSDKKDPLLVEVKPAIATEEEILNVAMGVSSPEEVIGTNYWTEIPVNKRDLIHFRREVRRGLYKIIKYKLKGIDYAHLQNLVQLEEIIGSQLDGNLGITWRTFADKWDIHPKNPLTIILKEHWVKEGGGFDVDVGVHYPHAFTVKKEQ
jgi:hypothetical protein